MHSAPIVTTTQQFKTSDIGITVYILQIATTVVMSTRGAKRKKETMVEVEDFYRVGKEMQNRSGTNIGAINNEDRRFRESFGCGAHVALALWLLLIEYTCLPEGGMILHMLWALHFMKVYPRQDGGSSAAGGSSGAIDPKTWRKYLWPFIEAIAYLEQFLVSC